MNSQEIIEKIKVVLGLEATETHTESASAPVVELAEVTIDSEELEALRSERDDLKKKVDELQAIIDERNAKDNEIKPQPKEPRYLYVYIGENDRYIFSMFHPSKYSNPECIGKIKLEVEDD